jgi:DNA-binding MarR family transcriptional regulator
MAIRNTQHAAHPGRAGPPSFSTVRGKLVRWLLRYPLQRVEDIVLALEVSTNTIYRHLTKLVGEGLVEYVTPSLSVKTTCRLYYLSNAGLLVTAEEEQADARSLARLWDANEQGILRLFPRVPALVRLQNLVNGLVTQAPAMLAHTGGHQVKLTWHWMRDYEHDFLSKGNSLRLSADAVLLLGRKANARGVSGTEHYCALLFLDPGFVGGHDRQLIMQKLEALVRYRRSPERGDGSQPFPPVVVLVQTLRQREIWQQCAAQVATALSATPLIGAIAAVPLQETLDAVWTLPWQKLAVPAACRLRDLFVPLPREALLPDLFKQRKGEETASSALKKRRILHGDFSRRAKELSLAFIDPVSNNHEQEREVVALLSMLLSQRHLELLDFLYAHPLLDTKELATLLNLQADSVARYLYELRRYGWIEKCDIERGRRWHIADRGLRLIAASHHCLLSHIAESILGESEEMLVQHGIPLLKKSIARTTGIYALFTALHRHAHTQSGDHSLLWWETGGRCEHHYIDHGVRHSLRPHAAFAYKAGNTRLFAWLEWEEGTASKSDLAAKMQTYAHFVKAREWLAAGFQTLPVLCIIVPEKNHLQRLAPVVTEQLADSGLLVRMTTAKLVAEHGPLAPVWTQLVPSSPMTATSSTPLRSLLDLGNSASARNKA